MISIPDVGAWTVKNVNPCRLTNTSLYGQETTDEIREQRKEKF